MDADYRDGWCDQIRGVNQAADAVLDGHGQCGASLPVDDRNVEASVVGLCHTAIAAWVPYFTLCIGPTDAHPVGDEVGFAVLRAIADDLARSLVFKEPVVVSGATDEAGFVRDWVAAGFPTREEVPEWYCFTRDNDEHYVWQLREYAEEGSTYEVSDDVDRTQTTPRVTLTQSFPGNSQQAATRTDFIIRVTLGNHDRCIDRIWYSE